ncbi:glutathione S-transferase family protein [Sphingobium algorifonticola]|uniref:Glutathione S-transferase family protein n=1 Tax=Sphingobium algorifonticola TaxID=2008318 RepID=A0A437J971_9SPHN|nr:glutathione S-transferase family protein [Sphingobium algorifonticola]RVT41943.1 glutathione S-transferase family protein [Sphingobium algorifonticola]
MITLYGTAHSRTHRVLWLLRELGLAFEHIPTDFVTRENRDPAFLAVNPNGRVPALVDGDITLWESLTINLYLSRRYGGEIAARGFVEETLAMQWSMWAAAELDKALFLAATNLRFFAAADRNPDDVALALRKLSRPFAVLDGWLTDRRYILGDRFTVADLNVAAVLSLVRLCGLPVEPYPAMSQWLGGCLDRPAADDYLRLDFKLSRLPPENYIFMFL